MKCLLLLSVLLPNVLSKPLICESQLSDICTDLWTAKGCGMVKECIEYWEQLPEQGDTEDVCKICKDMVKQARDQLLSKETQEEMKEVFEGTCALIPVKEITAECDKLVDEFIPELLDMLASQMNPEIVCATAGLCNNYQLYKDTGECTECDTIATTAINKVKHMDKKQLEDTMLEVCGMLGSLSDGCRMAVVNYFPEIASFIENNLDPNLAKRFCKLFGFCEFFKNLPKVEETNDEVCSFCKQIIQHWRDILIANSTEHEFEQVLHGLCKRTGKFKDECDSLVTQYAEEVYDLLVTQLDPDLLCKAAGLCPGFNTDSDSWVMMLNQPIIGQHEFDQPIIEQDEFNQPIIGQDESNSLHTVPLVKLVPAIPIEEKNLEGDATCIMCEYALHYLQVILMENQTESEIKTAVETVCDVMPNTVQKECRGFIELYGEAVITILAQKLDPTLVCPFLKLCPGKLLESSNDEMCVLCEFAVTTLFQILQNKTSEEEIRLALDKLCDVLPSTIKSSCEQFVDEYSEKLIDFITHDVDPKQLCTQLGLCSGMKSMNTNVQLPIERMFPNLNPIDTTLYTGVSGGCIICEFVLEELDKMLKAPYTEPDIEKALDEVCDRLPESMTKDCRWFVHDYTNDVINILKQAAEHPSIVCAALQLCENKGHAVVEQLNMDVCSGCKMVVGYVDRVLENPVMEDKVDQELELVCEYVPKGYTKKCSTIIEEYGPYIMQLLGEFVTPDVVCENIDLCPKNSN